MSATNPDSDGIVERPSRVLDGPPSRYDVLLAVIPVVFLVAVAVGTVGPLELHDTMLAGGFVGAMALVDALFLHPPA